MGLGSARVFPDEHNMKGIKGHLLKFRLNPKAAEYALLAKHNGNWILAAPHRQSGILCVGTQFAEDQLNPYPENEQGDKLYKALRSFILEVSMAQPISKL